MVALLVGHACICKSKGKFLWRIQLDVVDRLEDPLDLGQPIEIGQSICTMMPFQAQESGRLTIKGSIVYSEPDGNFRNFPSSERKRQNKVNGSNIKDSDARHNLHLQTLSLDKYRDFQVLYKIICKA
ncbi:hypothetical protein SUGI_1027810 [Cryptomeria japonica]|nr:hypothetical protein SUGI_1027810 [Cryptomeria japonica]